MATGRTKWESYGRTRCPKNIAGAHGTAAGIVAFNAMPSGITATDGTAGYPTENQRYLHVTVKVVGGAPGRDINIWYYSHASGVWSTFSVIDCDAILFNQTYVLEISGADRIAFQGSTGAFTVGQTPIVYAACTTF